MTRQCLLHLSLETALFDIINQVRGPLQVDLFATSTTVAQVLQNPEAEATDVFAVMTGGNYRLTLILRGVSLLKFWRRPFAREGH
jgi:hypothetical protein